MDTVLILHKTKQLRILQYSVCCYWIPFLKVKSNSELNDNNKLTYE